MMETIFHYFFKRETKMKSIEQFVKTYPASTAAFERLQFFLSGIINDPSSQSIDLTDSQQNRVLYALILDHCSSANNSAELIFFGLRPHAGSNETLAHAIELAHAKIKREKKRDFLQICDEGDIPNLPHILQNKGFSGQSHLNNDPLINFTK